MIIKVRKAKPVGNYRLEVEFSDDTIGERDFSFIKNETGPMLEPPKDPAYFRRVFVEDGRDDMAERVRLGSNCPA
jgi:hypothetical protein